MVWSAGLLSLLLTFAVLFFSQSRRSAVDVVRDLSLLRDDDEGLKNSSVVERKTPKPKNVTQEDEYFQAGFFRREDRIRFEQKLKRRPVIVALILGSIIFLFTRNPLFAVMGFSGGLCGTFLLGRRALYNRKKRFLYDIDFYLPVVMERLVMTAQAGLDVFSGIRVIGELARNDEELLGEPLDPVTALLERVHHLNERGVSFEEALSQVADKIESPALRHSFIHLAVAQKEGGELVGPLRELSDSTQAYFQETIEEQIAKLPVKATLPLLVTFAGLVIFFMTSPMMQVMKLSAEGIAK
ncbi:MAG: type II secretion system F family protein [Bdellovibrionales bacterium]|nr:type II secretion system F family protein [Bdellovibrionales bacterium]